MALGLIFVVIAYLIGTFPTAHLVGTLTGHDPTREGSRNPGASNVYRTSGKAAGAAVFIVDVLKGAVPAAVGWAIDGRGLGVALWAAAVLGHVFPVFRRFRGGKGVATAGGGSIAMWPIIGLSLVAIFFATAKIFGKASVGSLLICVLLPTLILLSGRPWWEAAAAVAISALVAARHWSNIARLLKHEEPDYNRT